MALTDASPIVNGFTLKFAQFVSFLHEPVELWPAETKIIHQELDKYTRSIVRLAVQHGFDASQLQQSSWPRPVKDPCLPVPFDVDMPLHDWDPSSLADQTDFAPVDASGRSGQHQATTSLNELRRNQALEVNPLDTRFGEVGVCLAPAMLSLDGTNQHMTTRHALCSQLGEDPVLSAIPAPCPTTTSSSHEVSSQQRRTTSRATWPRQSVDRRPRRRVKALQSDETVKRLYASVGGVDSLLQLKMIVQFVRQLSHQPRNLRDALDDNLIRALKNLEGSQCTAAFQRRILLLKILRHRDARLVEMQDRRRHVSATGQPPAEDLTSAVLDNLIQEAYPETADALEGRHISDWRALHHAPRKWLSNHLTHARKWERAVAVLGLGIVAWVPTGGEWRIQNSESAILLPTSKGRADHFRVETLREEQCETLLSMLKDKNGGCVSRAAALLTPFVHAVYEGKDNMPRLRVEQCSEQEMKAASSARVLEMCTIESGNNTSGDDGDNNDDDDHDHDHDDNASLHPDLDSTAEL